MAGPSRVADSDILDLLYDSEPERSESELSGDGGRDSDLDEAQLDAHDDAPHDPAVGEEDGDEGNEEDDGNDTRFNNMQWSPRTAGLRQIPFTKQNELLVPLPGENKPIDWFSLLLDDDILLEIVTATNEYAWQVFTVPNLMPKSRINRWKDLTVGELKTFIGIVFYMGTVKLNRISDYWKTHRMFNFNFVREKMSRDRFLIILRCLHFSRNDLLHQQQEPVDRLYKIRMLINYFNSKMASVYYPGRELSIDEGTVLWRGRLQFRQYIKGKRHKYGIKLYSSCEPEGLCLSFVVYSGKDGELSGKGHGIKVVNYLMRGKFDVGHALFMDNYYNSVPMADHLLANSTYCTGTLLSNRKFLPADVKEAKLKKGEKIERYAQGMMIGKWKDKRQVLFISTQFENDWAISNNRFGQPREKPLPIVQYNAHMKGVDRSDQMMSYYTMEHKSLRWYKKIFIHLLQLIMINAYKLNEFANDRRGRKMSLYDFRLAVIDQLLPQQLPQLPRPRQLTEVRHVLSKPEIRDAKGNRNKRRRCRQCAKEKKKTLTVFVCAQCPGEPGLCALACFDKWHAP